MPANSYGLLPLRGPRSNECRLNHKDEQVQKQLTTDQIGTFPTMIQVRTQDTVDGFGGAAGANRVL